MLLFEQSYSIIFIQIYTKKQCKTNTAPVPTTLAVAELEIAFINILFYLIKK